jgi:hypothetical protein
MTPEEIKKLKEKEKAGDRSNYEWGTPDTEGDSFGYYAPTPPQGCILILLAMLFTTVSCSTMAYLVYCCLTG